MKPRILLVHDRYLHGGGEDAVFLREAALLRGRGHDVVEYVEDNQRIRDIGAPAAAVRAVWSSGTLMKMRRLIRRASPDIAHFHNTFPLVSPSAYSACREAGIPVVQTLHNYRLLCASAQLFRSGRPCEDCMHKRILWPGVLHACYRGSRVQTAAVTVMLQTHRALGTWRNRVDLFIALSEFSRRKFIEGGIEEERIAVKPNFVSPDPGERHATGEFALFVGRLSPEKGIRTLLEAWRRLPRVPLAICGDGPMRGLVDEYARSRPAGAVRVLGATTPAHVLDTMKQARMLVFPSAWYESFPLVIAEAFACGLPVISADIGAAAEIVDDGRTGVHFRGGDPESLAEAVRSLWESPVESREMGRAARAEFLAKYGSERNYETLMALYARACAGGMA